MTGAPSWLGAAPPEEIAAGPLRLRRWRAGDAETLARLVTDNLEHLRPWMAWAQQPPTVEEERTVLRHMQDGWERRSDFAFGVLLGGGRPEPIGGMGLHTRRGPGTLEIGYWIAAAHTARGYATTGARALTTAAFALPGVERVQIHCDEANRASAAVPRKLGYRLVAIVERPAAALADTGRDMVWSVERADWAG